MREIATKERTLALLEHLGQQAKGPGRIYLTGGSSAVLIGWRDRSIFIDTHGKVEFYHYDFYSQALAKLERAHGKDLSDVSAMLERKLIETDRLLGLFESIKKDVIRYPALDLPEFESSVTTFIESQP